MELATDAEGNYDLDGLRPGSYRLSAGGTTFFNQGGENAFGRVTRGGLRVEKDAWLSDIDLRLPTPGRLNVTVRDVAGEAVRNASVFVRDGEGRLSEAISFTMTDAMGQVELGGIAPGEYTVSARAEGLASHEEVPVRVTEGGVTEASLHLDQGTVLWLRFRDADGEQVKAQVSVRDNDGNEVSSMLSMSDIQVLYMEGAFSPTEHRLGPLPPGKYEVTATANGKTATKNVRLKGEPEKRIIVRIR